jgi:hypothetical protein
VTEPVDGRRPSSNTRFTSIATSRRHLPYNPSLAPSSSSAFRSAQRLRRTRHPYASSDRLSTSPLLIMPIYEVHRAEPRVRPQRVPLRRYHTTRHLRFKRRRLGHKPEFCAVRIVGFESMRGSCVSLGMGLSAVIRYPCEVNDSCQRSLQILFAVDYKSCESSRKQTGLLGNTSAY